mmetsp:Transcript_100210/g.311707  ORF Transcript_100210/g.311707 Transcript_100210/m.311707 type:complete len:510 (-) Transcript_100210:129-1658(-)
MSMQLLDELPAMLALFMCGIVGYLSAKWLRKPTSSAMKRAQKLKDLSDTFLEEPCSTVSPQHRAPPKAQVRKCSKRQLTGQADSPAAIFEAEAVHEVAGRPAEAHAVTGPASRFPTKKKPSSRARRAHLRRLILEVPACVEAPPKSCSEAEVSAGSPQPGTFGGDDSAALHFSTSGFETCVPADVEQQKEGEEATPEQPAVAQMDLELLEEGEVAQAAEEQIEEKEEEVQQEAQTQEGVMQTPFEQHAVDELLHVKGGKDEILVNEEHEMVEEEVRIDGTQEALWPKDEAQAQEGEEVEGQVMVERDNGEEASEDSELEEEWESQEDEARWTDTEDDGSWVHQVQADGGPWKSQNSQNTEWVMYPQCGWQDTWAEQGHPQDDWMVPFDELICKSSCNASPANAAVCIWKDAGGGTEPGAVLGDDVFTDGLQVYKSVPSSNGQPLYTDGCQLYAPVCVVVAAEPCAEDTPSVKALCPRDGQANFDPYNPLGLDTGNVRACEEDAWERCWG